MHCHSIESFGHARFGRITRVILRGNGPKDVCFEHAVEAMGLHRFPLVIKGELGVALLPGFEGMTIRARHAEIEMIARSQTTLRLRRLLTDRPSRIWLRSLTRSKSSLPPRWQRRMQPAGIGESTPR